MSLSVHILARLHGYTLVRVDSDIPDGQPLLRFEVLGPPGLISQYAERIAAEEAFSVLTGEHRVEQVNTSRIHKASSS